MRKSRAYHALVLSEGEGWGGGRAGGRRGQRLPFIVCLVMVYFIRSELGQMVMMSKYRGTTRYRYQTFEVSKYRLTTGWLIFNVISG